MFSKQSSQPLMVTILSNRKISSIPLKTGVDYAGPVLIKEGGRRSRRIKKVYIALFVSTATKAIHVELVCDLTSETFLNAVRRFISKRGIITHLFSDDK